MLVGREVVRFAVAPAGEQERRAVALLLGGLVGHPEDTGAVGPAELALLAKKARKTRNTHARECYETVVSDVEPRAAHRELSRTSDAQQQ